MSSDRISQLKDALARRILILDGAMGTALQAQNLTAADFGGADYEGCNEYLVLTKPDAVQSVHEAYLAAGADIIETNTFGGTGLVLAEYALQDQAGPINTRAVELVKAACQKYETPDKPRFIAGAVGPTTKSLSVTGGITFDELADTFAEQLYYLIKAGSDFLLFETALDTLNLKAAYIGALKAFEKAGREIPIAISGTIETMGTMLAGQGVEALYASVEHMNPLYIGLNCATGPEFMRDHIRTLAAISRFPVSVAPNAGIPDADGVYPEGPDSLSNTLFEFAKEGWVNVVGGCCGTTPAHIQALADKISPCPARSELPVRESRVSGIEPLVLENENRPYIIGERTNVIGSRAFKKLIEEEKWDEASEIARKQVKSGAHIIDVCLSNPDRNENQDIQQFLHRVTKMIKVPVMIDSQMPDVVEASFKLTQGKCMLNSVNLEDGEKSFEELLPLVRKYGAMVVVGCIRGEMAVTAVEKLDVAKESHRLLTQKYGIAEEDIIFDPLVFPCGTGDANYFGSGKETIEGVRLIKETFPRCKTTLGISNVSFGLPPAGREVLNSVFLYHCVKTGLDTAIVNAEKLVRFSQITEEEMKLCDDLLWYRTDNGNDPVANFAAYFRGKQQTVAVKADWSHLTLEKRIEINIVEGTKDHLIENLEDALKRWDPLGVINGPLMDAMAIVGRMFNANELIVAEVLQSAEVMKTSVSYLEQFMRKSDIHTRAKMLLATVKGDVHDIGKNLVQIILSNNGYQIIDLGIKCPPETLIEACKTHQPDLIGLSGLLVKSAQQMVSTASDLKAAGVSVPILVGGAALTENFTNLKIAPEYEGVVVYCKDAMSGLDVANQLSDTAKKEVWIPKHRARQAEFAQTETWSERGKSIRQVSSEKSIDYAAATAITPHYEPVVVEVPFETIWPYVNPQMVYGNHLGLKGKVASLLTQKDSKAMKLHALVDSLKDQIIAKNWIKAKGVYRFFKVRPDGTRMIVLHPDTGQEWVSFDFPRQPGGHQYCLTDFLNPAGDSVCFFVVTCGDGVSEEAKKLLDAGNYFESHGLSAIALESAEGFAEYLHQKIRTEWGIPDPPDITPDQLFKLKYTGKRYSFGYPACPHLEDQALLWKILDPEHAIGVTLSEEYMMYPEASVSALVIHHPRAVYFSV